MMAPYRPPGRSNRSGRTHADNDVFEGLPVKQWGQAYSRVSLAPPQAELTVGKDDKWGDPPMPRDYQMLTPWTQHLLRLARSGKVGTKRKQDADPDEDKPDDEQNEDENAKPSLPEERGYLAKKWKLIPEHALEPEHKHLNFLAKRRKGLSSIYSPEASNGAAVAMRKTKVQKTDANGEVAIYEVLVPEGQSIEGEITETTELGDIKPVTAAPGTVIEGVGVANEEGVVVAEHLRPSAPRRNRPPPKKKGGPGRGKKRVTFTNPDGSTYTTIVPNATKIVPQPGQTVKHVAKGEEAGADVSVEEAARRTDHNPGEGDGEGENGEDGSGSDDEEGDDDDDREEGELSDDDAPATGSQTPAKPEQNGEAEPMEDVKATGPAQPVDQTHSKEDAKEESKEDPEGLPAPEAPVAEPSPQPAAVIEEKEEPQPPRDASSSPEMPLANSHSRTQSLAEPPPVSLDTVLEEPEPADEAAPAEEPPVEEAANITAEEPAKTPAEEPAKTPAEGPAEETTAPLTQDIAEEEAGSIVAEETVPADPISAGAAVGEHEGEKGQEGEQEDEEEETEKLDDGDEDLLGNLEKHLETGGEKKEEE